MTKPLAQRPGAPKRQLPKSFKDLTPSQHFNPRTFFRELVWKALLTRRSGQHKLPSFPRLTQGQIAITWIGHASFLVQFTDLNVLIDPNFANWLFLLKRIKRSGLKIEHLPPIDLVLLTHAHFDHFHKPTLRRLPRPKIGVMPWGVGDLALNLGFARVIELEWWEAFAHKDWKVTLTPSKHWGARVLRDNHRGYGGFGQWRAVRCGGEQLCGNGEQRRGYAHGECRGGSAIDHGAASESDGDCGADGFVLGCGCGHGSLDLSVEEEWCGHRRCDVI